VWGQLGSGRTELMRAILGLDRINRGKIALAMTGGKLQHVRPRSLQKRVAYVTESRREDGLFMTWPVWKNVSATSLARYSKRPFYVMAPTRERADAVEAANSVSLVPPDVETQVQFLSGGNQQKVTIAKWLRLQAPLFIFDEPTRGVDVGSRADIQSLIRQLGDAGVAVVVVTSDPDEMVALADRVIALRDGAVVAELAQGCVSVRRLVELSLGRELGDVE
jgi:ribose transport system ATP-binding protein